MKEVPILFSTSMVQAILEGRKSQTRRLIKEEIRIDNMGNLIMGELNYGQDSNGPAFWNLIKCKSKWQAGDVLWVRENWQLKGWDFEEGTMTVKYATGETHNCLAHDPDEDSSWLMDKVDLLEKRGYIKPDHKNPDLFVFTEKKQPFSPSIHMPKEAARIWLRVKGVRVERLQDISTTDIEKEGIGMEQIKGCDPCVPASVHLHHEWKKLWEKINGADSWQANPWLWVISFTVLSTTGKPDLNNI